MALRSIECFLKNIYSKHKYFCPVVVRNIPFCTDANHKTAPSAENKEHTAVKVYLEQVKEYGEFLQKEKEDFILGKKYLAKIMGRTKEDMTQEEVDAAINYLFPSKLFSKSARPILKPPEEVFEKKKEPECDISGRPYHSLFYTGCPQFTQILHDAAKTLEELNLYESNMRKAKAYPPNKTLILSAQNLLSKKDLEKKTIEKLSDGNYEKFIELFEKLKNHPYNYVAEEFITSYLVPTMSISQKTVTTPAANLDGTLTVTATGKRKTALASVTVTYPGSGKVVINGKGIDYFAFIESRLQLKHEMKKELVKKQVEICLKRFKSES